MTSDPHIELLAQDLSGRRPLLTLSPAAVAAPVLSLLVIAAVTLFVAVAP
ncbi:hypothetical protein ABJI51_28665 [Amycolatopsis sp. NEAU-NG30]|jgi:hypothetical protein|uniref:ABC transporter permease n=1 Tax=Amycolatopsis melonis TaxID=3156488 RepID=A0ABV0LL81_9PSEU